MAQTARRSVTAVRSTPARRSPARRPAPRTRAPRLRVVRSDERIPRSATSLLVLSIGIIAAAFVATVVLQARLAAGQAEIDEMRAELQVERELGQELGVLVTELESPERILIEAERLGMVDPANRPFLAPIVPGHGETVLPPPGEDPFGPRIESADGDS